MPRGVPKDKSVKRKLLHRLKISRGHLDRVISMVENDEYCIDIVHQSISVQAALKKIDRLIIENHLKTCVSDQIRKGNDKKTIMEVMQVIEKIS